MQTERQTNCRRVWTDDEYKRRNKRKGEREKCTSGPSSKWGQKKWCLWIDWVQQSISNQNDCWKRSWPDLGWLCQNFQLRSMAVLYQPVSRPYPSVSSSLSLLSLLSLSVVKGNMVGAKHSGRRRFFFQFDTFKRGGGHLGIRCLLSSVHFITTVTPLLHRANPLFAVPRVPALQACAWCPLHTEGAHCRIVVPIAGQWCPLQTCGHNLVPIVQEQSAWPALRQTGSLMRYIWTCTSTHHML